MKEHGEQNTDKPREGRDLDAGSEDQKAKTPGYEKPTIVKLDERHEGDFWCD
jgi:hypothetical protein